MLIDHLFQTKGCDARGMEYDLALVTRAVARGLLVMHGDADTDLALPDSGFDYVVLSRTLQAVERPREVLRQMLRIATRAVVSFPNFGHWLVRGQLLAKGRMRMTATWDRMWYETPNIHPCTIRDFFDLHAKGYAVERWLAADEDGRRAPGAASPDWPICSASRPCSCCDARPMPPLRAAATPHQINRNCSRIQIRIAFAYEQTKPEECRRDLGRCRSQARRWPPVTTRSSIRPPGLTWHAGTPSTGPSEAVSSKSSLRLHSVARSPTARPVAISSSSWRIPTTFATRLV